MPSPHEVLGVDDDADKETVERAYRKRVKEVHPDAGGSTEAFKRVQHAYRAMTDDETAASSVGKGTDATASRSAGTASSSSASGSDFTSSGRDQYMGGQRRGTGDARSERSRTSSTGRQRRTRGPGAASSDTAGTERGDRTRQRRSGGGPASGTGRSRRWFLYGLFAVAAGVLWQTNEALTRALGSSGSDSGVRRGSATRELGHEELFPVGFEASAGSTVRLTVDGADTRDYVSVYTKRQYEWVRDRWTETGEFDPGNPLETVLTDDGYVAELPRGTTYVALVKLWRGPPEETRTPRTVEVTYEIRA